MKFDEITKEKFDEACARFPENIIAQFMLKYFQKDPKPSDKWLKKYFFGTALVLFVWGLVGTIVGFPMRLITIPTAIYVALLLSLGVTGLMTVIKHTFRRFMVRKSLGVTLSELVKLEKKFYPERFNE